MYSLLEYSIKLSVSLAVVYLFYYCILRKLTFYNQNRWYLVGYTVLSFFIPFINVTAVLQKNNWQANEIVNWVPLIDDGAITNIPVAMSNAWAVKEWLLMVVAVGMLVMILRLLLQVISFKKMLRNADPVNAGSMKIYQVDDSIIPFSFGNAIFINRHLHSENELQEIIQHEFVHVKQRHSIDIIWAELLCIINWYNPFAWLIKKSIRQNLEFIADHKVLENGIDKKEYQYLLLKVIGNNQYSIATQFNFSSLKKRIAMMNKTKSAKRQLIRLLFLLPATAVLLLAFRSKWDVVTKTVTNDKTVAVAGLVVDAKTLQPLANANIYCKEKNMTVQTDARGYYLLQLPFENKPLQFTLQIDKEGYKTFHQAENWGNFYQDHIFKRYGKSIEYFGLTNDSREGFSSLVSGSETPALTYDNIAATLPKIFNSASTEYDETIRRDTTIKVNSKGYMIRVKGSNVIVKDKAGKEVKRISLDDWNNNSEKYEDTYGMLPPPPPPPAPPVPPLAPAVPDMVIPAAPPTPPAAAGVPPAPPLPPAAPAKLPANVKRLDIDNNKATIWLKNGKQEKYDLNNAEEKEKFEKKYGKQSFETIPDGNFSDGKGNAALNTLAPISQDDAVAAPKGSITYTGEVKMLNSKTLVILDGKEMAANPEKLNGKFKIFTLNKEEAVKKYDSKGENGAIELHTIR